MTAGILASAASVSRRARLGVAAGRARSGPAAMPCSSSSSAFSRCSGAMRWWFMPDRDGLRGLQKALGAVGEFLEVHLANPSSSAAM